MNSVIQQTFRDSWIIPDFGSILVCYAISIGFYYILKRELAKPELEREMNLSWLEKRSPEWLCSVIAAGNIIFTGLLAAVPFTLYWLTVIWLKKSGRVQ